MKIGEALQTQASSLYSATPIGAPMRPAPIGVADRTRKKNYWRTVLGQHCLLAQGTSERQYIGAQRPPCANILAHQRPPAPILLADRTQKKGNNVRILNRPGGGIIR
jgi:hypothetical protein